MRNVISVSKKIKSSINYFRKLPWLTVIVLIAISLTVYFFQNYTKNEDIQSLVLESIVNCKDKKAPSELNSLNMTCLKNKFKAFVNEENISQVLSILEEMFGNAQDARVYGTSSCHNPAHIAGQIVYNQGMTFSKILNTCSIRCGFGCQHGAFQDIFHQQGAGFIENIEQSCLNLQNPTDDDVRACWHIVGHGVGEYFVDDLENASNACMKLSNEKYRWHCFSGLRMEYVTPSPGNPSNFDYSLEGYLNFCNKFPKPYDENCYAEAGYVSLKIMSDEEKAIQICAHVPLENNLRLRCVTGGGATFTSTHKDSPYEIYDFCKQYGGVHFTNECVIGAIDVLASEWYFMENGPRLCNLVKSDFKSECLAFLGTRLTRWYDDKMRHKVCDNLSEVDQNSCFNEPKNPRAYLYPPN